MKTSLLLTTFLLFITLTAHADVIPTDENQEPESPQHEDLLESSPSSPPLSTDDPGTPGAWGFEVNLLATSDSFAGGENKGEVLDANLGLGERWQLRVSKEMQQQLRKDQDQFNGYGATSLGLKWRFYNDDDNRFKVALYPSYQFDDRAGSPTVDSEGTSLYLPIIIQKTFRRYTFVFNAGATKNFKDDDSNSSFLSFAVGRAMSETLRISTELTSQNTTYTRRIDGKIGFVKEIFPNEKSIYETGVFGSVGHNIGWTDDGQQHWNILVGFAFARKAVEPLAFENIK